MKILIVDDYIAPQIHIEVLTALHRFNFVEGRPEIFISDDPDEADKIYAENDIDLAFIDIDLGTTRNGFELNIFQEKKTTSIQKNVVLFVSSKIEGNEDREKLINGITLADFLIPEKRAPHFINAFSELENIGKIIQLQYSINKHGYIKVSYVFLITRIGDYIWLYFSDTTPRKMIYKSNIKDMATQFKKAHTNTLIKINPTTIVNTIHWIPGKPIPDTIVKDGVNMNISIPNKNLL